MLRNFLHPFLTSSSHKFESWDSDSLMERILHFEVTQNLHFEEYEKFLLLFKSIGFETTSIEEA